VRDNDLWTTRPLTASEYRVLELVALGLSSRDIGERLWVSRQAVTYHISNLFTKLQANSRASLVARAYALGVLEPTSWPPSARPAKDTQDRSSR
jgi:DNA-binding CsgD family transcriptional regulator